MKEYRVYRLDHEGHIFAPPHGFTCASDEDAIAAAKQLIDGHDIELWQATRLVVRLPSNQKQR
jgi:hypothetical protein